MLNGVLQCRVPAESTLVQLELLLLIPADLVCEEIAPSCRFGSSQLSLLIYLPCSPPSQADQAVQRLNYLGSDFSHRIISRLAARICPATALLKSFCWAPAIAGPSWKSGDTNLCSSCCGKLLLKAFAILNQPGVKAALISHNLIRFPSQRLWAPVCWRCEMLLLWRATNHNTNTKTLIVIKQL